MTTYTLQEVALRVGLTPQRVGQIARKRKLGKPFGKNRKAFTEQDVERIRNRETK